jgi:hypothetical protein
VITAVGSWVEALKISPEKLEAWSNEATPGVPLLVWCLQAGKISSEEYLHWAAQYFNLPVVHERYFKEAFDAQYLESERTKGGWTAWCFPVEQWDDVTIVACVEPPAEQVPFTCYVLADANTLKEVWNLMGHTSAIGEMPEGLTINPTKAFTLNLDSTSTNLFGPATSTTATPLPPTPDQAHPDESQVGVPPLSLVLNLPTEENELPPVPQAEAAPKAPAEAPKKVEPAAKKTDVPKGKKRSADSAKKESGDVQAGFVTLRETFDHGFVMRCHDHFAELYAFDPDLEIKNKAAVKVDLAFPTFFRITFKTAMPYHGYLVDSPAHREFFSAVGLPELPKCVTAVPVKANGVLHGMIVAIGSEKQQTPEALKLVEDVANSLEATLLSAWSQAA